MSVEETLEQRGSIYGDYKEGTKTRGWIMETLREHKRGCSGSGFTPEEEVMVTDLVNKLVRFAGSPTHVDSIHDLAGYATLIERTLI
jgi:Ribonuclease G/E